MAEEGGAPGQFEELWRSILLGTNPRFRRWHRLLKRLPSDPRCKLCGAPFHGPLGPVMRRLGRAQWSKNPKYCERCDHLLRSAHGGAEIECSLLFADVRGSTSLAEQMRPAEFGALMERFFRTAADVLIEEDAIVDKFVGDEVVAIFVPALAGADHARRAIDAALGLLRATGHGAARGPWVPIGVGVTSGTAYVGAVGAGPNADISALGDVVNVAARLASAAAAGEVLVALPATQASGLDTRGLETRHLDLRGRNEPIDVIVLGLSPGGVVRP